MNNAKFATSASDPQHRIRGFSLAALPAYTVGKVEAKIVHLAVGNCCCCCIGFWELCPDTGRT
jgi:hypothetical protein